MSRFIYPTVDLSGVVESRSRYYTDNISTTTSASDEDDTKPINIWYWILGILLTVFVASLAVQVVIAGGFFGLSNQLEILENRVQELKYEQQNMNKTISSIASEQAVSAYKTRYGEKIFHY